MRMGTGQYRDDKPLRASPLVDIDHTNLHLVVVHDLVHLVFGQENVVSALFGDNETVTIRMAVNVTGDEMGRFIDLVIPFCVAQKLAVTLHRVQPL